MDVTDNIEIINYHKTDAFTTLKDKYTGEDYYSNNITVHYKNGKKHRDCDLPALTAVFVHSHCQTQRWYIDGSIHRDNDKPAIIEEHFTKDGKLKKCTQLWYKNNTYYRENNKPYRICTLYDYDGKMYEKEMTWLNNPFDEDFGDKPVTLRYFNQYSRW